MYIETSETVRGKGEQQAFCMTDSRAVRAQVKNPGLGGGCWAFLKSTVKPGGSFL